MGITMHDRSITEKERLQPRMSLDVFTLSWLMCVNGTNNANHPPRENAMNTNNEHLGDDLEITKISRQASGLGTWVIGLIAGHRFDALVFPEHAESEEYELGDSRISKLWIRREADQRVVLNFDRGWDIRPTTNEAAAIADFLAAGLAEHVFGN